MTKMTEEKFWEIVDKVDWKGLCAEGRRPYEAGGERMLELLPTWEDADAFLDMFSKFRGTLYKAFETWEKDGEDWHCNHNPRSFGLGDDSFGDLIAHCIGLGREEYTSCLADPERAWKRATNYDFTESFSYCIPFKDAYDPIEEKLERAMDALNYWIEQSVSGPRWATSEVERRVQEVAKLRSKMEGREVTPDEINKLVRETQLQAQESLVVSLTEQREELNEQIEKELAKLNELRGPQSEIPE